ncbi:hypothetical protein [Xanthomonas translucens]|uniref:hypothetical protein n=1 Tax=Xanthomonas campestris pv. translucens TaxID=343 RepID=UPI0019D65D06|nr:hypothetical protein [Xanthomonas translucens]QSQ29229.1 hypothetical protein ISN30_12930 [Xanthomonas translucens pv. translucens]
MRVKIISLSAFVFAILMNGVGCSVSEKAVYGDLQALDLQYAENRSDLLVAKIGTESAVRFRAGGGGRVWWALNQLSKEKEIYSFPANGLTPTCRAIDKLKQSARLDGDFEKKAYSTCKK